MPFGEGRKGPSDVLFPLRFSALFIMLKGYLLILSLEPQIFMRDFNSARHFFFCYWIEIWSNYAFNCPPLWSVKVRTARTSGWAGNPDTGKGLLLFKPSSPAWYHCSCAFWIYFWFKFQRFGLRTIFFFMLVGFFSCIACRGSSDLNGLLSRKGKVLFILLL